MNYYAMDGSPMTMREWGASFDIPERQVGDTAIGEVRISTVWLGLDHNYHGGPPLIFETMIFGGLFDEQQWRYSTLTEAQAGHVDAVALVRYESALDGAHDE